MTKEITKFFALLVAVTFSVGVTTVESIRATRQELTGAKNAVSSYLRPEHKSVLVRWLKEKRDLRVATESDCTDKESLGIWRKDWGKDFNPYYSIGDFNGDGKDDFAVLLVDLKNAEKQSFAIAIFNAPFGNRRAPNYFEEGYTRLGRSYIVYNQVAKRRLYLGVYESDFYCVTFYPKGAGYYFKDCLQS